MLENNFALDAQGSIEGSRTQAVRRHAVPNDSAIAEGAEKTGCSGTYPSALLLFGVRLFGRSRLVAECRGCKSYQMLSVET